MQGLRATICIIITSTIEFGMRKGDQSRTWENFLKYVDQKLDHLGLKVGKQRWSCALGSRKEQQDSKWQWTNRINRQNLYPVPRSSRFGRFSLVVLHQRRFARLELTCSLFLPFLAHCGFSKARQLTLMKTQVLEPSYQPRPPGHDIRWLT